MYFSGNVSALEWNEMFEICHLICRAIRVCVKVHTHTGAQYAAQTKDLEIGHTRTHT